MSDGFPGTLPQRELSGAELTRTGQMMPERVAGPRAYVGPVKRFIALIWMLAYLEFKMRFFDSVLGYAWQLLRPLFMFGTLYFVFTQVIRIGGEVPFYPVTLLSAIVIYTFFTESTLGAVEAIFSREALIRKVSFPLLAAPLASVTAVVLTLGLNYLVVIGFALASGADPSWRWLEILPLLGAIYVVAASVGMTLSALYIHFRDVKPIWEVITQVMFYASPVIYTIEFVSQRSEKLATLMMCNPLVTIIQQMRHAVIDPNAPTAVEVLGGPWLLAVPVAISVGLLALGIFTMRRMAPRLAEAL